MRAVDGLLRYRMDSRIQTALRSYCLGLCMGTADAVPGVSGGTVALLLGFYERLVSAVAAITPGRVVALGRGYDAGRRAEARIALEKMDLRFLVPLGLGVGTAVLLVARAVTALAESDPLALFGFFAGLIAVSAVVLVRELALSTAAQIGSGVVGAVVAFVLAGGLLSFDGTGYLVIAFVGALAISAMILPGLSGSLLLLLFGQYVYLSSQLTAFTSGLWDLLDGGSFAAVRGPGTTVVVFVLGGFVGLLTIARVVRAAFERAREVTLAFLVGLVAGSTRAPVTEAGHYVDAWTTDAVVVFGGWAALGGLLVFGLDRLVGGFTPE